MRGNVLLAAADHVERKSVRFRAGGSAESSGPELVATPRYAESWRPLSSAPHHTWVEIDYSEPDPGAYDPEDPQNLVPLSAPVDLLVATGLRGLGPNAMWRVRKSAEAIGEREVTYQAADAYGGAVNVTSDGPVALAALAEDPFAANAQWLSPIAADQNMSFALTFDVLAAGGFRPGTKLQAFEILVRRPAPVGPPEDPTWALQPSVLRPKIRVRLEPGMDFDTLDFRYWEFSALQGVMTFRFGAEEIDTTSGVVTLIVELYPVVERYPGNPAHEFTHYIEVGAVRLAGTMRDAWLAEFDTGYVQMFPAPSAAVAGVASRAEQTRTAVLVYGLPAPEPTLPPPPPPDADDPSLVELIYIAGEAISTPLDFRYTQIDIWSGKPVDDEIIDIGRVLELPALDGWILGADWTARAIDSSFLQESQDGTVWADELPVRIEVSFTLPDLDPDVVVDVLEAIARRAGGTRDVVVVIYPEDGTYRRLLTIVGRFVDLPTISGTVGTEADVSATVLERIA